MIDPETHQKVYGMSHGAKAMLEQLFKSGPTWDGNVITKAGRGELIELGLAERGYGFAWLTRSGVQFAIERLLLGEKKI